MIRRLLWSPLLLAAGCGLFNSVDNSINNGVQGATATHLAVITVLQSPPIPGVAGSPTESIATIFFGNRPNETVAQPDPVTGATITIADNAGLSTQAVETGQGFYVSTSIDGGLRYDSAAVYTFTFVDSNGVTYTAGGTAAAQEEVDQLETTFTDDGGFPEPVFAITAVNVPYTITRSADENPLAVAFVAVFSLDADGTPSATPTWTNAPQQPGDFLQLIVNDSQWRAPSVTIAATAFPSPGLYLVTLTAVSEGASTSDDLFNGSAVLLGASTVGLLDAR